MQKMKDLIKLFDERTDEWEAHLSKDEWFFSRLRDELVSSLTPADAFELLPQAATLILRQQEYDCRCSECVQLLLSLARQSETTEMPHELSLKWQELMFRINSFGEYEEQQASELCRWYRKEHPTRVPTVRV